MSTQLQIPATSVATLLRDVLSTAAAPSTPALRGPLPDPWVLVGLNPQPLPPVAGRFPQPWQTAALNPQPLPPVDSPALTVADDQIRALAELGRTALLVDGAAADRALEHAIVAVSEFEELCPRWPDLSRLWRLVPHWPPRPPRPNEQMTDRELFVYGLRLLDGAHIMGHEKLQTAVTGLAEKAINIAVSDVTDG